MFSENHCKAWLLLLPSAIQCEFSFHPLGQQKLFSRAYVWALLSQHHLVTCPRILGITPKSIHWWMFQWLLQAACISLAIKTAMTHLSTESIETKRTQQEIAPLFQRHPGSFKKLLGSVLLIHLCYPIYKKP